MKQRCLITHIYSFVFFVLPFVCVDACTSEDLAKTLEKAMKSAREVPFEGVLSISRKISPNSNDLCVSKVKICRLSAERERMETIEPEILKNHVVAKLDDVIWVTPLSEEFLENMPPEIRFHHLFRIFRDITGSIDLKHFDLLLENYDLTKEKTDVIADRVTSVIYIKSKHLGEYNRKRPSMRFWIDNENYMPLKCQNFNCQEQLFETIHFEDIRFDIADSDCEIDTNELIVLPPPPRRHERRDPAKKVELNFSPLISKGVPKGFNEISTNVFERNEGVVLETNYSDGLTSFSTYQRLQTEKEIEEQDREPIGERWKVKKFKDRDIYYREILGIRIITIGDLDVGAMNYLLYKLKPSGPPEKPNRHPHRQ